MASGSIVSPTVKHGAHRYLCRRIPYPLSTARSRNRSSDNTTDQRTKSFQDVSPEDMAAIEREHQQRSRRFRFCFYDRNSQLLAITIPTGLHEALHVNLYNLFRDQLVRSGDEESWKSMAATTFWMPDHSASNHEVKIVLLAKFFHQTRHVIIERWEEEPRVPPESRATMSQPIPLPVCRETIEITQNTTTSPVYWDVSREALVLRFRILFLQDPRPQEGDIIISVQKLQRYAEIIWAEIL
ncbi:hypothetical protein B0T26DRAFT_410754 [Lasiosphaeria miniovina]|uniref:Uncharacterized protein n=1 Tax=Lasiosphaeria miniovina TaxID=1954250 RepID=A0AA40DQI3_9PEZI|nr:uncharacterized protein B0T26DRAFT_410754 [Lasiosphaeria miniovina]KAK0709552.1 hypothetical protein B0T26DRAFT_410754 [Lasiosphaeria miniovina]